MNSVLDPEDLVSALTGLVSYYEKVDQAYIIVEFMFLPKTLCIQASWNKGEDGTFLLGKHYTYKLLSDFRGDLESIICADFECHLRRDR